MEMVPQRLFCCIVHISASDIDTLLKLVTMQLYQKKICLKRVDLREIQIRHMYLLLPNISYAVKSR